MAKAASKYREQIGLAFPSSVSTFATLIQQAGHAPDSNVGPSVRTLLAPLPPSSLERANAIGQQRKDFKPHFLSRARENRGANGAVPEPNLKIPHEP